MCLIFLSYNQHPKYPLIIAANRDEFLDRPALPMDYWPENPNILAGQDLTGGGTWLGVTTSGYFSMLTNYRDMANIKTNAPTRGKLVLDYLKGEFDPATYLQALDASGGQYNGYNILLGTMHNPWYYSNQNHKFYQLGSGLYGLSNALLDSNWPKVDRGKTAFRELVESNNVNSESLFELMINKELADDDQLPDTGIGIEKEKLLSSMFIDMQGYGTRNTTILIMDRNNTVEITERTYSKADGTSSDQKFNFSL